MSIPAITVVLLVFVTVVSLLLRDKLAAAISAVLLGNWAACTLFSWYVGDVVVWYALAAIDIASAVLLAVIYDWHRSTRLAPLFVSAIYVGQLVCHAAFGWAGTPEGVKASYFMFLTWGAWLQACLAGASAGGNYIQGNRHFRNLVRRQADTRFLRRKGGQ